MQLEEIGRVSYQQHDSFLPSATVSSLAEKGRRFIRWVSQVSDACHSCIEKAREIATHIFFQFKEISQEIANPVIPLIVDWTVRQCLVVVMTDPIAMKLTAGAITVTSCLVVIHHSTNSPLKIKKGPMRLSLHQKKRKRNMIDFSKITDELTEVNEIHSPIFMKKVIRTTLLSTAIIGGCFGLYHMACGLYDLSHRLFDQMNIHSIHALIKTCPAAEALWKETINRRSESLKFKVLPTPRSYDAMTNTCFLTENAPKSTQQFETISQLANAFYSSRQLELTKSFIEDSLLKDEFAKEMTELKYSITIKSSLVGAECVKRYGWDPSVVVIKIDNLFNVKEVLKQKAESMASTSNRTPIELFNHLWEGQVKENFNRNWNSYQNGVSTPETGEIAHDMTEFRKQWESKKHPQIDK